MTFRGTLLGLLWGTAALAAGRADTHLAPIELRRAMPFVQVLVDGKGPFTFGIDTGTGTQALVSPALAETLGLAKSGEVEAGDPSGRAARKLPLVKVGRLSVAGVEFRDLTAAVYLPSQAEGRCDGILGFVLFRDWLLTLDYRGSQLVLAPGRLTASTTARWSPSAPRTTSPSSTWSSASRPFRRSWTRGAPDSRCPRRARASSR